MSIDEYGTYSLFFGVLMFVLSIYTSLFYQPYQMFKYENSRIFNDTNLVLNCSISLLPAAIIFFLLSSMFFTDLVLVAGFSLYLIAYILYEAFRKIFVGNDLILRVTIVDVLLHSIRFASLWVFIEVDLQFSHIFIVLSFSYLIQLLYLTRPVKLSGYLRESFIQSIVQGKWLLATALLYTVSSQVPIYLLGIFESVSMVGVFSMLLIPIGAIRIVQNASESFLLARLSRLRANQEGSSLSRKSFFSESWLFYFLMVILLLFSAIFPKQILELFYQEKLEGYHHHFLILIAYALLQTQYFFMSIYFKSNGWVAELFRASKLAVMWLLPFMLLFIFYFGLLGMIGTLVLSSVLNIYFCGFEWVKKCAS